MRAQGSAASSDPGKAFTSMLWQPHQEELQSRLTAASAVIPRAWGQHPLDLELGERRQDVLGQGSGPNMQVALR